MRCANRAVSAAVLPVPVCASPTTSRTRGRRAVVYQVYPRSFQDTDGDGLGDVRGITSRDLRMARLSAEHAAHLGLEPDVAGLTQIDPGLDTAHADEVAPFYSALFAAPLRDGEPVDPSGQTPTVW